MNDTQAVTIIDQDQPSYLEMLGSAANRSAARNVLGRYQDRKAQETKRRQAADIKLFETYLAQADLLVSDMATNLNGWSGVTWGLVEGFCTWSLTQGYAIGSINVRLATIKAYAKLASKHGSLDAAEYSLIKAIEGYQSDEGRNADDNRKLAMLQTRRPKSKKAEPTSITLEQARRLKQQPDTKKGRRDTLLMCLLLDLGLRCGEIAGLDVSSINLDTGILKFYRHKVHKTQELQLTAGALLAARSYLEQGPAEGPLFTSTLNGEKRKAQELRINERTINARIGALGRAIGLVGLSPHDCRHYFVTNLVRNGTDMKSLQDAGGWSNPAMPLRYAESSKIANQGVKLTV